MNPAQYAGDIKLTLLLENKFPFCCSVVAPLLFFVKCQWASPLRIKSTQQIEINGAIIAHSEWGVHMGGRDFSLEGAGVR